MNKPLKDWTLADVKQECRKHPNRCFGCKIYKVNFCPVRGYPTQWDLSDPPRFSPAEVEAAKAIRMLYPGATHLRRGTTTISAKGMEDMFFCVFDAERFPSIEPGETVYIDDIIACGGA